MKRISFFACVALFALAAAPCFGTTWNVPANYGTVYAAVNAPGVLGGDTILVDPAHVENVSLTGTIVITKGLTIATADPNAATKPVLDGGGTLSTIVRIYADDVTLDGLEIRNGKGDLVDSPSLASPMQLLNPKILNCEVHHSSGDEGVQLRSTNGALIEGCVVHDIAQDALNICCESSNGTIRNNEVYASNSENGAIYVYDSRDMTVEENYVHDCTSSNGIFLYYNYGGTDTIRCNLVVDNTWIGRKRAYERMDGNAVVVYKPREPSTAIIQHNTIANFTGKDSSGNPTGHGIHLRQLTAPLTVNVLDNIVANNNGYGISTWGSPSVTYSYCDLWNNGAGATDGVPIDGGGNISADPLFDTAGSGMDAYRLLLGSPCIGTASDGEDIGFICWPVVNKYSGVEFLPPIALSNKRVYKRGSVIPVKVRVFDLQGNVTTAAVVTLDVWYETGDVPPDWPEETSVSAADTGNTMRVVDDYYIFNLSTKPYVYYSEINYLVRITLDDGQTFDQKFSLR